MLLKCVASVLINHSGGERGEEVVKIYELLYNFGLESGNTIAEAELYFSRSLVDVFKWKTTSRAQEKLECPASAGKETLECPASAGKDTLECPASAGKDKLECPASAGKYKLECPALCWER